MLFCFLVIIVLFCYLVLLPSAFHSCSALSCCSDLFYSILFSLIQFFFLTLAVCNLVPQISDPCLGHCVKSREQDPTLLCKALLCSVLISPVLFGCALIRYVLLCPVLRFSGLSYAVLYCFCQLYTVLSSPVLPVLSLTCLVSHRKLRPVPLRGEQGPGSVLSLTCLVFHTALLPGPLRGE